MRTLSGIQPSGKLHVGNYFGALRQFVSLQDKGDPLYFIADLHAMTTLRDGRQLREYSLDVALDYMAFGLDPQKAVIWRQSDVSQHTELAWMLGVVAPMGLLERAHSFKDKVARGIAADVGLFYYPVLMAADILLYSPDRVPVGQDQKQHLEITRDICTKFNMTYVPGYDPQDPDGLKTGAPGILKQPDSLILDEVAVIPGTDGQKMSKSYNNTLELFAPDEVIRKKIMGIKTDSTAVEAPKPDGGALLTLLKLMATDAAEAKEHERTWREGGVGYGTYKKRLVELFFAKFNEARTRRQELERDLPAVEKVLAQGAERARAIAAPTWNRVVQATGCGSPMPV